MTAVVLFSDSLFFFFFKLSAHVFRAWRNPTFFFQVWKRAKVKWRPNNFANNSGLFICSQTGNCFSGRWLITLSDCLLCQFYCLSKIQQDKFLLANNINFYCSLLQPEVEDWSSWDEDAPTSVKIEGGNGNVAAQQNAVEQMEPDYFKDMTPTIRKTQKVGIELSTVLTESFKIGYQ